MERIRQMSLKKALFTIAFFNITVAFILSAFAFWGCMEVSSAVAPQGIMLEVHSDPVTVIKRTAPESEAEAARLADIISVFQFMLPVLFYIAALFTTASVFYRLKLKEPLAVLAKGASRIIDNDLDFTMEAGTQDELGQLCTAFETMRKTLLANNRELWRQAEERKRLNAAFSHNLRNPVTVLKGAAKLARKSIGGSGAVQPDRGLSTVELNTASGLSWDAVSNLSRNLSLIESYTDRMERYIETMSSIRKLEEVPLVRENIDWNALVSELEHAVQVIGWDSGKQIRLEAADYSDAVWMDSSILLQIAENFVSNALRFAKSRICVSCHVNGELFELSVTDDGCGFPDSFLKNGIQPFQKGIEDAEHFGMGLYISSLLAGRHGGSVAIGNRGDGGTGAVVSAFLKIK